MNFNHKICLELCSIADTETGEHRLEITDMDSLVYTTASPRGKSIALSREEVVWALPLMQAWLDQTGLVESVMTIT